MKATIHQVGNPTTNARQPQSIEWRKILYASPTAAPGGVLRDAILESTNLVPAPRANRPQDCLATNLTSAKSQAMPDFSDLSEDFQRDLLTRLPEGEKLVFVQVVNPNRQAWLYALADAGWDEATDDAKPLDQIHVKIEHKHLANGLGFDLDDFESVLKRVRLKVAKHRKAGGLPRCKHEDKLRRLEVLFGLPTPLMTVPFEAVRRLLICTARERRQNVTPEVAQLLREIGVKSGQLAAPPKTRARKRD